MPLHGLSDRFLAAVAADQDWAVEVLVKTSSGTELEDITESVIGGSVTVDETRQIRRQCTVDLEASSDLIPEKPTDLLHPATGNELWISRGVAYGGGASELAPLGVFRLSKPKVSDQNSSIGFALSGNDRASVVARQDWQKAYQVATGSNPAGAIQQALETVISAIYPNMDFSSGFQTPTFLYPPTTWGVTLGQSNPMSDLQSFAAAAGCELFFDVNGNPVFRSIVNPGLSPVVDAVHFVQGENCTMLTADRTFDETIGYNGVQLKCNGPGDAGPFTVTVWDTDPSSPTYYKGAWGQVAYPMTTTLIPAGSDTLAQATVRAVTMAQQQLQLILGALDTVDLTCVPNPALQEGDCVQVSQTRTKIGSNYVISSMTIPLDPETEQSINFRPQVSAS